MLALHLVSLESLTPGALGPLFYHYRLFGAYVHAYAASAAKKRIYIRTLFIIVKNNSRAFKMPDAVFTTFTGVRYSDNDFFYLLRCPLNAYKTRVSCNNNSRPFIPCIQNRLFDKRDEFFDFTGVAGLTEFHPASFDKRFDVDRFKCFP